MQLDCLCAAQHLSIAVEVHSTLDLALAGFAIEGRDSFKVLGGMTELGSAKARMMSRDIALALLALLDNLPLG